MANFCTNCGNELQTGASFCPSCGAPVAGIPVSPQANQSSAPPAGAPWGAVREGIPAPGFSDRVNHPEILAAVKKNQKAAKFFTLFLVPVPLIGFILYSLFTDKMEFGQAALYGVIISGVFLLFALFGFIKNRASNAYEADVIDQHTRRAFRHSRSDNAEMVTEYVTVVRTTAGKKQKIVEWEGSQVWAYGYLHVGDRFRYHPQFAFPYELFDKSRAPYIACVSCGRQNPVTNDRCEKCRVPLLK